MERSSSGMVSASALLALVSAVHGVFVALRLPPRLVFQDEAGLWRIAYALVGFALAQAIALPVWGAFSDRFGRDKVIRYSLLATILLGILGFAIVVKLRLPQLFLFSVVGGIAVSGLVLSASYTFSLLKQGTRFFLFGQIFCGFFGGMAVATAVRWSTFSLPRQDIAIVTATLVLLISAAALALVNFFLPEARATSVSYTGMNAMHGLWHGFAESNRAKFAWWWKIYLGSGGLAAGILLVAAPALLGNEGSSEVAGKSLPLFPILVFLFGAASSSFVAGAVLQHRAAFLRFLALGSSFAAFLSALIFLLLGQPGPAAAYLVACLAGMAAGSGVTASIGAFAAAARQRSGGAEMGAVLAIWLTALMAGMLMALTTLASDPKSSLWVCLISSLTGLFVAFMATRKTS